MGTGSDKKWQFVFGEYQGYSPARDDFTRLGRKEPRVLEHLEWKLESLQTKPLERLIPPVILIDLQNGLWELVVEGGRGVYYFLGSVEHVLGASSYVALGGYRAVDARTAQIGIALARLEERLSKEFQKYVYHGLPQL